MMSPICRLYKSGKKILVRVGVSHDKRSRNDRCIVYSESKEPLQLSDLHNDTNIIPLICIDGIRFTSRSFENFNIIDSNNDIRYSTRERRYLFNYT